MPFLCDLVWDVVQTVEDNFEVDRTKPHRENVQLCVLSAVKRVLRRNGVTGDEMQVVHEEMMEKAKTLYQDRPRMGNCGNPLAGKWDQLV